MTPTTPAQARELAEFYDDIYTVHCALYSLADQLEVVQAELQTERDEIELKSIAAKSMRESMAQLAQERDAYKIDAERYRYLRDSETLDQWIWNALEHTEDDDRAAYLKGLDTAVDAAIKGAAHD